MAKRSAIAYEEYSKRWKPMHNVIFSGREIDERPFRDPDWPNLLLAGGLRLAHEDFEALASAAKGVGDAEIVLVDGEGAFPGESPLSVPWSTADIEDVRVNSVYGHIVTHSFGASGTWGLAASPEEFAVLGGSPGFIRDFVHAAGGEDSLRRRFQAHSHKIGFGEQGRTYVARLLGMVGWDQ